MKQLSPQDAQFLYIETNKSFSQVTSVAIFDPSTAPEGTVRFKQIIEHVRSRLYTSPIYRRRIYHVPLELDYPYWVDDEHFDIEYHIRHGRLPHPADWRQLCIHLARFHTRPLDMQRAPWEMYVIEGIDNAEDHGIPKGAYAIATKIHHAAADGMAMVNFFGGLLDLDPKGTPVMPKAQMINSERFERPSLFQLSARGLINNVKSPFKVSRSLLQYAPKIIKRAQASFEEKTAEAKVTVPQTRFNLETSPHRVFDAVMFDLKHFKPMRSLSEGCTVNDIVLAVCSGALRNYLIKHKELPAESLRAFCPVNVRSPGGSDSAPGNNISTMSPSLFTNIADAKERLEAIHAETKEQKAARRGISARLMTDVTRHAPAATQLLAARLLMSSDIAGRMTNVCISNVPGPQVPVYMNGAQVVTQMGMGPLADRMGLFIAVTSQDGKMTFGVTSCRRTLPDVDFFTACITESFNELLDLSKPTAQSKPKPKPKPKPKTKPASKKVRAKKTATPAAKVTAAKVATKKVTAKKVTAKKAPAAKASAATQKSAPSNTTKAPRTSKKKATTPASKK